MLYFFAYILLQSFPRKNTVSVAKTTVHVVFDESGSQVNISVMMINILIHLIWAIHMECKF